jgi:hypothetical protein
MRQTTIPVLAILLLITPFFVPAAAAQTPDVRQLLQGLLSGNQVQDQALHEAFERGYQRGREDEARQRAERDRSGRFGEPQPSYRPSDADQR